MSNERQSASSLSFRRVLGWTGQAVGALGAIIGVVLVVVVLLGRGRAADRLDEIAAKVDAGIAKGIPLLAAARERVEGATAVVGAVGTNVEARADSSDAAAEVNEALQKSAAELSDRYLGMRARYAEAREHVVAALERLNTIDLMLPAISVPTGPVEALASLDERVRVLDTNLMGLIKDLPDADSGPVATAVQEKVGRVKAALLAVASGLGDTGDRLQGMRTNTAAHANRVHTLITVTAIVVILALLYSALLHWVLYHAGRRKRREASGL
jgi:hypothetical protein